MNKKLHWVLSLLGLLVLLPTAYLELLIFSLSNFDVLRASWAFVALAGSYWWTFRMAHYAGYGPPVA